MDSRVIWKDILSEKWVLIQLEGGMIKLATAYLIRHGETDFSQMNIAQGQMDVPINDIGIQTAKKIGDYIADNILVDKVFKSDLLRCKQTCEILVSKLSNSIDCVTSTDLREISLGIFEGQPMEKLNFFRYNSGNYNSFIPEGGESFEHLTTRVENWLFLNFHKLDNALIITHRGPISVIVEGALNRSEFMVNDILKQGNIIQLRLDSNEKYWIEKIIEVVNRYD